MEVDRDGDETSVPTARFTGMRQLTIIMALALVVAACSETDAATSTTSTAPVAATVSSTTSTPTTKTEPETTSSTSTAARTPSTEAWGTWTLIWGSDTQAATAGGMFSVEGYLGGFAW